MQARPGAKSFRARLRLALMLVVATTTGVALYLTQQRATVSAEQSLQREFQQALAEVHHVEEARLATSSEHGRALAKSVRIRVALEDNDAGELYYNATLALRDLLEMDEAQDPKDVRELPFRFLDLQGKVISPAHPEAWEKQIAVNGAPHDQQTGYLALKGADGGETLMEIISTPIVRDDTRDLLGAVVLKFKPTTLEATPGAPLHNGVLLGSRLYLPSLSPAQTTDLAEQIRHSIAAGKAGESSIPVRIEGAPHLLFYKLLNPGSRFPPAYEVCVYPLTESLIRQRELRWQILGAAAALLLAGLIASHFLSRSLSKPVARLEVDSAENRAHRERAEAALELTNEELRSSNAELQKALANLKAAQRQIIQQERLRALGQMASGIAHDFNNALVPILGFCELLQLNPAILADPKKSAAYLETIQTAAKDASSVVGRLREFYRGHDEGEVFTPVNLKKLAEQSIKLTQPKWKGQAQADGATVEVVFEGKAVPPIAGSESSLREMLTNLIFNAVDAMPHGGRITVRTREEAGGAVLEVADTGTGMTEEVRQRCLEPFFSTKGERGTGLGLSMVFGIVQRHGGSLDLQSEPGRGTTFSINFPLMPSGTASADAAVPQALPPSLRVLLVDDEAQVRNLLREVMTNDGHTVEVAEQGVDGLRRFMAGKFDLVVTDKAMPGMSGDQMAAAIKQVAPKTPIILLTGFGQFIENGITPNVDVVAAKPIGIVALRDAITTALKVA